MLGLQQCAAALTGGRDPKAQQVCVAKLTSYFADQLSAKRKLKSDEIAALISIAKSLPAALDHAANNLEQLLELADNCFACCKQHVSGTKHQSAFSVLLYSYVKKLVGLKRFQAALQHGQLLLADLHRQESNTDDKLTQDLLLGAALNVVICTCKADQDVLPLLHVVNTAAVQIFNTLRSHEAQAAEQHAAVLSKYLLELVAKSSAEAAQQRSLNGSYDEGVTQAMTQLLLQTWAAASMTNQQSILQQVAMRMMSVLPLELKHHSIVALLQAAGLQPVALESSSSTSVSAMHAGSTALLDPSAFVSGLQVLLTAVHAEPAAAAACTHGLMSTHEATWLCRGGCMIMLVLALRCENILDEAQLDAIRAAAVAAGQHSAVQADCEQQIDDLSGQLSNISIAAIKQGSHSSNGNSTNSKPRRNQLPAVAIKMHQKPASSEMSLEFGAWFIQQLIKSQPQSEHWLLSLLSSIVATQLQLVAYSLTVVQSPSYQTCLCVPLLQAGWSMSGLALRHPAAGLQMPTACASCAVSTVSMMMVNRSSPNSSIPWQLAAQAMALAGKHLASSDTSRINCQQQQVLQQLYDAVQDILRVPHLCDCIIAGVYGQSDAANVSASSSCWCPFSRGELQWLSWQLYDAAVTTGGSDKHSSNSSSSSAAASSQSRGHWAAPRLLLLGWQCSCACLAKACAPQQSQADRPTAVAELLQHAQAYLSYLWCRQQEEQEPYLSSFDTQSDKEQQHNDVQQVVSVTVAAALQHVQQQEEVSEHRIEHHLDKLIGLYSKLRCQQILPESASVLPPEDRSNHSRASNRNSSHGPSRGRSKSVKQQQQQEEQQLILPSVVQLVAQCTSSSWQPHMDWVCWLECRALWKVSSDPRLPALAAATALTQVVQQLTECCAPPGCGSVVFEVQKQLVLGMIEANTPAHLADSSSSRHGAVDTLQLCYSQAVSLLTEEGSSQPAAAAAAANNRTAGRRPTKQRTSRKEPSLKVQGSDAISAEAVHALSDHLGWAAAGQILACAAVSSCLLGLAWAVALMQHEAAGDTAAHEDAAVQPTETEIELAAGSDDVGSSSSSSGATEEVPGSNEDWSRVYFHWQLSSHLFQLFMQLHADNDSRNSSMRASIRFPGEAAAAVAEASHIAGLQGWSRCQAGFAQMLAASLPVLSAQQQAHLQPLQQTASLVLHSCQLGLLLAPTRLCDDSSSIPGSGGPSAPCGTAVGKGSRAKQTAGKAAAVVSEPGHPSFCSCALQGEQQSLMAALQQCQDQQQVPGTRVEVHQQLKQALLLLSAGQVAVASGDATTALIHAEAALELSKAAMVCVSGGHNGSVTGLAQLSSKHAGHGGLYWHAMGLYLSGLWQLSQLFELAGNPDDAIRVLKELSRISRCCHCCCMAALAHATISSIYSKLGDEDKAATAAATASQWLEQLNSQQQHQQQLSAQEQLLLAVAAAAVGQAKAACCASSCQHHEAQQHLQQQLGVLQAAVHAAISEQQPSHDAGTAMVQPPNMLLWKAVDQRARLQLQLSQLLLLTDGPTAASAQIAAAVKELFDAGGGSCKRCCQVAWSTAHAALRLQQLLWSSPSIPQQPYSQQALQLVGFFSSSSHSNLQAEFACAAADRDGDQGQADGVTTLDVATTHRGRKARSNRKQPSAALNNTNSSSSSRGEKAAGTAAANPAAWLTDVLQLLPACVHDVLLLKGVCSHLSSVLQAYGAVSGAAMLLHMSLGVSVAKQQQLTIASKLLRAQQRSSAQHVVDATDAAAQEDQDLKCQMWQQLQHQLDLLPTLTELGLLAQHNLQQMNQATDSNSGSLMEMLSGIDRIGHSWLQCQLKQLQPGTLACSITAGAGCVEAVAGAAKGPQPPLLLLPAAARMVERAAGQGLTICRSVAAAAVTVASQQLPLIIKLQAPQGSCIHAVLSELSSILSDSSASMQASEGLSSNTPAAAKWWKQRVALDSRLSAVLNQLDEDWLGPWRCLLTQPGQQQQEEIAVHKAQEFVTEHFDFVFEDVPRQLLSQLVGVLLVHLDACSTAELQRAMRDLCQLTQHRVDGLHINKLVAELTELHEEVKAAAAAAVSTSSGHALSSKAEEACGSQRRSSAAGVGGAAASAVYVTPAAPKARSRLGLMQASASAKKPPQSRLKAMQKTTNSSNNSSSTAVDDVSGLTGLMMKKLQLEEQEQDEAGTEAGHAAAESAAAAALTRPAPQPRGKGKAPATTARRVRFAQNDDKDDEAEEEQQDAEHQGLAPSGAHHLVPPPSLARHAVRRSRLQGSHGTSSRSSHNGVVSTFAECDEIDGSSDGGRLLAPTTPAVCKGSRSRLSSAAIAANASEQQQQQQQQYSEPWTPSVLLLLDGDVQQLPWESCAGLKQQSIYRCPGLLAAAAAATRFRLTRQASSSNAQDGRPTMSAVAAGCSRSAPRVLQLSSGFFLLNPDGDLQATQNTFQDWLQQKLGLRGVSGSRPASRELINSLQQHDMFLYFGHGGGEQYVPLAALKRLDRCAGGLLMGCSSGRLRKAGAYEPSGAIWGYLMAGCPAAVANLWDVTDRDIDRFAQSVLQQWADSSTHAVKPAHKQSAAGGSSGTSRHVLGSGDDASRDGSDQAVGVTMCGAVATARQACRLPHLIGAAAVCYGLPTIVQPTCSYR